MINPAHAKALRGHKTDAKDCARLAELFECGLLRGSYIPAPELKKVRDLTRYRMKTVQARTSEIQRLGKALESAPLTELRSVSAAQIGCPSQESIVEMSGRSGLPGHYSLGANLIATETGHTGGNPSPGFSSLPIFDVSRGECRELLQCP